MIMTYHYDRGLRAVHKRMSNLGLRHGAQACPVARDHTSKLSPLGPSIWLASKSALQPSRQPDQRRTLETDSAKAAASPCAAQTSVRGCAPCWRAACWVVCFPVLVDMLVGSGGEVEGPTFFLQVAPQLIEVAVLQILARSWRTDGRCTSTTSTSTTSTSTTSTTTTGESFPTCYAAMLRLLLLRCMVLRNELPCNRTKGALRAAHAVWH